MMKPPVIDFFGARARSEAVVFARANRLRLLLFRRAVRLASDVLTAAQVRQTDTRRIVGAALFGRLLTTAQAGVLLVRHGFQHDSDASLRLSFETLVLLRACAEQPDFYRRYLDADLVRQRKLANAGLKLSGLRTVRRQKILKRIDELSAEIKKRDAKTLSVESIANSVAMSGLYNSLYRLTSIATHVAARSLEDHASVKSGRIIEMVFGPSREHSELHLFSFTEFLIMGVGLFGNLCSVDRSRTWNRLYSDLKKFKPTLPRGWSEAATTAFKDGSPR
jgi:hypothetical protein